MSRTLLLSVVMLLSCLSLAQTEEVKIGILLDFGDSPDGPVHSIAKGAEIAISEASNSGVFLGGIRVVPVRAAVDCVDAAASIKAANALVTADQVSAIMGAGCSAVSTVVLQNVAVPNGVVMISPSSTAPVLSQMPDNGLFFRTVPSDERQGQIMAEIVAEKGINSVAVTYADNVYGQGLSDVFVNSFQSKGGVVTIVSSHEEQKASYDAEVKALAAAGGEALVVVGSGQDGSDIIRGTIDADAFNTFVLPDAMYEPDLPERFGSDLNGSFGQVPGAMGEFKDVFVQLAGEHAIDGNEPFVGESYDAAALIVLAMQAAGSSVGHEFKSQVMEVANAPGEPIYPGELAKALALLADGIDVDYVGASGVELMEPGDATGIYQELGIVNGRWQVVGFR